MIEAGSDLTYRKELLGIIQAKIDEHPRSRQTKIGPSEAGDCEVKIAWKLSYGGEAVREGGWAAAKGSVLHAFLDETFKGTDSLMPDGSPRFMSDMRLAPVTNLINGGTLDLYDRLHQCVIDWKLPGEFSMKAVRNGQLSETYLAQAMLYGLGLEAMGHPVSKVAIMWLPMCGDDLHGNARGAVFRYWDYDANHALATIANVQRIQNMIDVAGPRRVMEVLPKRSSFCSTCPAYLGNGDRRAVCPGVVAGRPTPALIDPTNPFAKK